MINDYRNLYIIDNNISFSTMRFHITINVESTDNSVCNMEVRDSNMESLNMSFDTLEEAFLFANQDISECRTIGQVDQHYKDFHKEKDRYGKLLIMVK